MGSGEDKPGDANLREHHLLQDSMASSRFGVQVSENLGLNYGEKSSYQVWQGKAWAIGHSRQANWTQFKQKGGGCRKMPLQAENGLLDSPSSSGGYGK